MVGAGAGGFNYGGSRVCRGNSVLGPQRELEYKLVRHLPAVQRLLPACQRRGGRLLYCGAHLSILGRAFRRRSAQALTHCLCVRVRVCAYILWGTTLSVI